MASACTQCNMHYDWLRGKDIILPKCPWANYKLCKNKTKQKVIQRPLFFLNIVQLKTMSDNEHSE